MYDTGGPVGAAAVVVAGAAVEVVPVEGAVVVSVVDAAVVSVVDADVVSVVEYSDADDELVVPVSASTCPNAPETISPSAKRSVSASASFSCRPLTPRPLLPLPLTPFDPRLFQPLRRITLSSDSDRPSLARPLTRKEPGCVPGGQVKPALINSPQLPHSPFTARSAAKLLLPRRMSTHRGVDLRNVYRPDGLTDPHLRPKGRERDPPSDTPRIPLEELAYAFN
jgi:hypothetical protein